MGANGNFNLKKESTENETIWGINYPWLMTVLKIYFNHADNIVSNDSKGRKIQLRFIDRIGILALTCNLGNVNYYWCK